MGKVKQWPSENNPGEKEFADLIQVKGAEQLISAHGLRVGGREIDAVILDQQRGWIYVVEVKDWDSGWQPRDNRTWLKGDEDRGCPFHQVNNALYAVKEKLGSVDDLLAQEGEHRGKIKFPIHPIVAFTRIPRSELQEYEAMEFFPHTLFADDLDEDALGFGDLNDRLLRASDPRFRWSGPMTNEDCEMILKTLRGVQVPGYEPDFEQIELETYRHRNTYLNVRGHAGTGKSVSLIGRAAKILEREPSWNLLVLCGNSLMAEYLGTELKKRVDDEMQRRRVEISDFVGFAREHGFPERGSAYGDDGMRSEVIETVRLAGGGDYEAVLIDEGQDFTGPMLVAAQAHLNRSPEANSFTMCRDAWQDIRGNGLDGSFEELFQHTVEDRHLKNKYRCLAPIVQFARTYVLMTREKVAESDFRITKLFMPEFEKSFPEAVAEKLKDTLKKIWQIGQTDVLNLGKLRGSLEPVDLVTIRDPAHEIPDLITGLWALQDKVRIRGEGSLKRIAVVYADRKCLKGIANTGDYLASVLDDAGIPFSFIATAAGVPHIKPWNSDIQEVLEKEDPYVLLLNVWQVKGLEADAVIFIGADHPGLESYTDVCGVNYVGMTRGRVLLRVVLQHENDRTNEIKKAFGVFKNLRGEN